MVAVTAEARLLLAVAPGAAAHDLVLPAAEPLGAAEGAAALHLAALAPALFAEVLLVRGLVAWSNNLAFINTPGNVI